MCGKCACTRKHLLSITEQLIPTYSIKEEQKPKTWPIPGDTVVRNPMTFSKKVIHLFSNDALY